MSFKLLLPTLLVLSTIAKKRQKQKQREKEKERLERKQNDMILFEKGIQFWWIDYFRVVCTTCYLLFQFEYFAYLYGVHAEFTIAMYLLLHITAQRMRSNNSNHNNSKQTTTTPSVRIYTRFGLICLPLPNQGKIQKQNEISMLVAYNTRF